MEKMNALTLIITLVVGVILTGALLGPVINDATKTTDTFENERAFYVTNVAPYTMTYADGVLTVNDVVTTLETTTEYSLVFSDAFAVRNYGGSVAKLVTLADITNVSASGSFLTSLEIDEDLHATLTRDSSGTPTVSEFDLEYFWGISPTKTDYVMTTGAKPIYVNGDDSVFTTGRTNVTAWSNTFEVKGSVDDGASAIVIRPPTGITVTDVSVVYEEIGNHDGYAIEEISFKANDTNVTYNRMVAPESVTMDITKPTFDDGERTIIAAIPIMVIVALLMLAVGAIAYRRAD